MPFKHPQNCMGETRQSVGKCTIRVAFEYLLHEGAQLRDPRKPFGLALLWPRAKPYLQVQTAEYALPFLSGPEALRVLTQYGINPGNRFGIHWAQQYQMVAVGELSGKKRIAFDAIVDTDDLAFIDEAKLANGQPLMLEIRLLAGDGNIFDDGPILLKVNTAETKPFPGTQQGNQPQGGWVALDFGNTSTTLAFLTQVEDRQVLNGIKVIDATGAFGTADVDAAPVESCLALKKYDIVNFTESTTHCASWIIGKRSRAAGSDGLVLGLKRLVASDSWQAGLPIRAIDGHGQLLQQMIPSALPAELFLCRVFQAFRQATLCYPARLAVTYPTTFNNRELNQLQETIARAWVRSGDWDWDPNPNKIKARIETTQPVCIDEASAAAFFFLYRRAFEGEHGLAGFQYQFPAGLNLLLYDCGGGTTDIALVHAQVESDKSGTFLKLRLDGRAGMRDFGGDNVTEAVFSLLKARITRIVAPSAIPAWPLDDDGMPVEKTDRNPAVLLREFLDQNKDVFDQYVPTRFYKQRDNVQDLNVRERRNLTLELWYLAEDLKVALCSAEMESINPSTGGELDQTLQRLRPEGGEALLDRLKEIRISRREVDYLILPDVLRSVKRCNHLIYEKLTRHGSDVHWVVAAGNAVRYPLIGAMLKDQLDVFDIEHRLQPLNEETLKDLKNAVVKGAVLALQKRDKAGTPVVFDTSALGRLPFDVGYYDDHLRGYGTLFREDENYRDCRQPRPFDLQPDARQNKIVDLWRHWPGDRHGVAEGKMTHRLRWEKYLSFDLPEGIPDKLTVYYDEAEHQFLLSARGTPGIKPRAEASEEIYCSPVQLGNL